MTGDGDYQFDVAAITGRRNGFFHLPVQIRR
jgi:hypothetical protein